jgi:hypothetical protein
MIRYARLLGEVGTSSALERQILKTCNDQGDPPMMKRVLSMSTAMVVLALLLASTFALAACTDGSDGATTTLPATQTSATGTTSSAGTTSSTGDSSDSSEQPSGETPKPGLYEQNDGTVQAVGILTYRDLEGGFWAVVETTDAAQADNADIIAVLGSSDQMPGPIGSYEDNYVSVIGLPLSSSVYQAGQFVELQSIRTLDAGGCAMRALRIGQG